MNAQELFKRVSNEDVYFETVNRWFCGKCGQIKHDKNLAESCCKPAVCDCGKEIEEKYYTSCKICRFENDRKREQNRFNKAEKLTEWDGPVFLEGYGNDGYCSDLSEFLDYISDEEIEENEIKYVWCCEEVPLANLDIDEVLNNHTEEAYEGFSIDDFNGLDELRAAVDIFNKKNEKIVSWVLDYSRCLLLEKQVKNEELAAP